MADAAEMMKLYSEQIVARASSVPVTDPLDAPDGTAFKRSPLCGSNVSIEVKLDNGVIAAFHLDVKACTLGQSAAAIFAEHAIGLDYATVKRGRDQLFAMLAENGPLPEPPFEELRLLEPAREFRNRHASILLIFDATLLAMDEAMGTANSA